MIDKLNVVSCENPVEYVWKQLRFFLNERATADRIAEVHKTGTKHRENVRKQAVQIGYCVRQAEEYFRASSNVGLPTRPLLLYYGAMSLTKALTLLRLDGEHSFDGLRKSNQHHHHGLEPVGQAKPPGKDDRCDSFFRSMQCRGFTKGEPPTPWGHFALFYESLSPPGLGMSATLVSSEGSRDVGETGVGAFRQTAGKRLISQLLAVSFNGWQLLLALPDMFYLLNDLHFSPLLLEAEAGLRFRYVVQTKTGVSFSAGDDPVDTVEEYIVRCRDDTEREQLTAYYTSQSNNITVKTGLGRSRIEVGRGRKLSISYSGYRPEAVRGLGTGTFLVTDPANYVLEPVSIYILLFCLGMISRYQTDIWMETIDGHVETAEVTDSLLNVAYRKFPQLMLDQLTDTHHVIKLA